MTREEKILYGITRSCRGLEIGPGYNPLLPKSQGWNVITVDHVDRPALIDKYERLGIATSRIEDVDVLWNSGPLDEAVPAHFHGTLDFCVTSHVIEHIPNPIGFFQSCGRLLKPGGRLSLAVPDKRYCFDLFQPPSCTADIIRAMSQQAQTHSNLAISKHLAHGVIAEGCTSWGLFRGRISNLQFRTPDLEEAYGGLLNNDDSKNTTYRDCHAWHFTPSSFSLILLELSQLKLIPFQIEHTHRSAGCEFIVNLTNAPAPVLSNEELAGKRMQLMRQALVEIGEQARQVSPVNWLDWVRPPLIMEVKALNWLRRLKVTARRLWE